MEKNILTLIIIIFSFLKYEQQALASANVSHYIHDVIKNNQSLIKDKDDNLPIIIDANHAEGDYPNNIIFNGKVNINQGNIHLQANEVQLYQNHIKDTDKLVQIADMLGNVHYGDNQVIIKGLKGRINLNTKDIIIWKGHYSMVGRKGHGEAKLIKQLSKNRYIVLINGYFTSCPYGSNIWSILGSKVVYDNKEEIIKIWNARFKIGSMLIFYSPYLQLPISNKKHSGFLIPNNKYSTLNYFELYFPYYWNIAPNMDITITPHFIYKRRNIMWENEFRYLTSKDNGILKFNYLPSDKFFAKKYQTKKSDRWMIYWQHFSTLGQAWNLNINYNKASDTNFFNDFNSKEQDAITDGYIIQKLCTDYLTDNLSIQISNKKFQILNKKIDGNYIVKPQIDINWYKKNDKRSYDVNIYTQIAHFINSNSYLPESTRLHFDVAINLPIINKWANINAETKLIATHYQQKNLDLYNMINDTNLKNSINRVIPQLKIDGKINLERNLNLTEDYIQTLEPHIQYIYIPYRNQNKIYNYDSSFLEFDYNSLFRDRLYGGLDRIASMNRLTTGIMMRIYNKMTTKYLNISIGQIYYFNKPFTDKYITWYKRNSEIGSSAIWIGDTYWHIDNHWNFHTNLQYDFKLKNRTITNSSIEYFYDKNHIQLTYRYVDPSYIQAMFPNYATDKRYREGFSQIGGIASWLIDDCWSIIGAYYFSTNTNKLSDQMINLKYSSCCYAIHINYERKLNIWNISNQNKYDKIIGFNIELRGLNSSF